MITAELLQDVNTKMNFFRHIAILLLLVVFSMRTVGTILAGHGFFVKTELAQQEKESELEKDAEKLFSKIKIEATDIVYLHVPVASPVLPHPHFHQQFLASLPQQYFAVPTPPPWCKS